MGEDWVCKGRKGYHSKYCPIDYTVCHIDIFKLNAERRNFQHFQLQRGERELVVSDECRRGNPFQLVEL
jgi:hypothetical protein